MDCSSSTKGFLQITGFATHPLVKFLVPGTLVKGEAKLLYPVLVGGDSLLTPQSLLQLLMLGLEPFGLGFQQLCIHMDLDALQILQCYNTVIWKL